VGRVPVQGARAERVKSADRSLDVLELLASRPEGATFAEIAGVLALPKSSAHGLLQTLLARGYTALAPGERQFRLGPRVADLGAAYAASDGALDRARAALAELAARSGETVHLVTLDGIEVTYQQAIEGRHTMRFISPLGERVLAHATAAGKVLLAALPNDEIVARFRAAGVTGLPRRTAHTTSTIEQLLRELEEVRRLGHAHDVEGFAEGVHCVAAPVMSGGKAVAALSVSAPVSRLDGDRLHQLAKLVVTAAGGNAAPATQDWVPGRVRVAWCMRQFGALVLLESHRAAAHAAPGLGADILWVGASLDERKQVCDVRHVLDLQPDVLVIHPAHSVGADALFREAAAQGVPTLCFQRPARSDAFALFAGGDTFDVGVQQVEFVADALGGTGGIALLEGDAYNDSARNVAEGNRSALSRYPGLRLVADEVCPDWSAVHARRIAGELLERPETRDAIDAFVCANDAIARGVVEMLAARGRAGSVLVVGHDGDRDALDRLRAGTQHATFFQNPATLGVETLRAAVALARGEKLAHQLPRRSPAVSPPSRPMPVLDVPYQRVTHQNLNVLERYWRAAEQRSA
jgi:DNA-binding IclR family transcriptional regulator/ABC-type xylose transport system substrate-binding protein